MEEKIMTLQVGLIGYGLSGSVFHAPLIERVEGLNLFAVVSSNPAKVHRDLPGIQVIPNMETLLNMKEIDLIVISSPNATHYDYAKKAILAGKHVVVEKPFTVTSTEADELIDLAEEKGVILTVFHNRRWDNDFLTVQRVIEQKWIGNLSTFESHFDRFRPTVRRRWKEQNLPGSGILYDLGSHLIDQALTLFGMPQTIWADLRTERAGAEAIDYFHLILGYPNLRVILHSGSLVHNPGPRFILHGDRGSFIKNGIDPQEEQLKRGMRPGDIGWGEDQPDHYGRLTLEHDGLVFRGTIETIHGWYESFYEGLVETIRYGKPAPVLATDARNTIRIIEYAEKSHQEQRTLLIR
jgi:scyllo-inositol 2-dehydrogenase (NADP+)